MGVKINSKGVKNGRFFSARALINSLNAMGRTGRRNSDFLCFHAAFKVQAFAIY